MAEAGHDDVLCESLPDATLGDITLVAWNWLRGEYLHRGNQRGLQIRAPLPESWSLNTQQHSTANMPRKPEQH